jgi:hypothetical protein
LLPASVGWEHLYEELTKSEFSRQLEGMGALVQCGSGGVLYRPPGSDSWEGLYWPKAGPDRAPWHPDFAPPGITRPWLAFLAIELCEDAPDWNRAARRGLVAARLLDTFGFFIENSCVTPPWKQIFLATKRIENDNTTPDTRPLGTVSVSSSTDTPLCVLKKHWRKKNSLRAPNEIRWPWYTRKIGEYVAARVWTHSVTQ